MSMAQLGSIEARMLLDISNFTGNMQRASNEMQTQASRANSKLSNFANTMTSTGKTMAKTVTAPIIAFVGASTKLAMDTEQGFAKVNSIAQLSGKEWENYTNKMKQGASTTGKTYSEYAEATYQAISAGVKYTDTTKFLDKANKLAVGGFTDLSKATDVLTTIQNAYGLSAKDTARISDVLIQTQNKGKTTVDELASNMGRVIPTAQSMGVSIEQLGASYAIMTAKGIATAESTTYMNSMFNELGKTGTVADKTLRQISGKSFKELTAEGKTVGDVLAMLDEHAKANGKSLSDMFGSAEAGKASLALLGNGADEFNAQLKGMEEASGATDKAFKIVSDTAQYKFKRAMTDLKNALSDFGTAMLPIVTDVAELASKFLSWASSMAQNHPWLTKLSLGIMGVLAVIAPLLIFIGSAINAFLAIKGAIVAVQGAMAVVSAFIRGKLIATIISLNMTLMANPIMLVVGLIAVLIGALVLAYNKCDWFREGVDKAWNALKEGARIAIDWVKQKLEQFAQFIADFPENFSAFVDGIVNWFSQLPGRIGEWLNTTLTNLGIWVLEMILKGLEMGQQFVTNCATWLSQLPGKISEWLSQAIISVALWVDEMINKAIQVSSEFVGNVLAFIILLPVRLAELLWNCITTVGQWGIDMWNKAIETGSNFVTSFFEWVSQLPGRLLTWLVDTIVKVEQWKTDMRNKAIEIGTEFVTKIIDWICKLPGRVWQWLVDTYNKAVNWKNNMTNKAREAGQDFLNRVNEKFQQLPGQIWNKLVECVNKAIQWAHNFAQKGQEGARNMARNVINGIQNLPSNVASIGRNIVQGLWNGITGMGGWLYNKVASFAKGVLDSMKQALGIHSPSRKARDEVGEWIPPGIGEGMEDAEPGLLKQARGMADNVMASLQMGDIKNNLGLVDLYNRVTPSYIVPEGGGASNYHTERSINLTIGKFYNNTKDDINTLMEQIYSYDYERRKVRGEV